MGGVRIVSRTGSVEARNKAFVKKSIGAWEREHRRTKHQERDARPYRARRGAFGSVRQFYGIIVLAIFAGFAAWPQVAPAVASLPGVSSLTSATSSARSQDARKTAVA